MSRVFIIHGYGGTPNGGWKPWVAAQLATRGHEVFVPAMPDADHPLVGAWTEKLQRIVGTPRPDDIFIGHSLGCIAIIRFLLTLVERQRIGHTIFVAGFYEELGAEYDELQSFLDDPIDWAAVKSHCPRFDVIHSTDDDSVPIARAKHLAEKLGVSLDVRQGYGHFSGGDGITELPLVLEKIPKLERSEW